MIIIEDKKRCCGCSACSEICPKSCIKMTEDEEGFLYPKVDAKLCVDCDICKRVCPILNNKDSYTPLKVWAAYTSDETIRKKSSSGGIFNCLATLVIDNGGCVFGTRYNKRWGAEFSMVETIEELSALMVSKYVQSDVRDAFRKCKSELNRGRCVLFVGTSCQISGLKHFLSHEYENLLSVEVVCHGVPSPKVWQMYLEEIGKDYSPGKDYWESIDNISFRLKNSSWDRFNFYIKFKNNKEINKYHMEDAYMRGFIRNLILRPSCYDCQFKKLRANADITIADFWGVSKFHPKMYDDRGTSIVIASTQKAIGYVEQINLIREESTYKKVIYCNPAIVKSHKPHVNRSKFFSSYKDKQSLSSWIMECLELTTYQKCKQKIFGYYRLIEKKINYLFS